MLTQLPAPPARLRLGAGIVVDGPSTTLYGGGWPVDHTASPPGKRRKPHNGRPWAARWRAGPARVSRRSRQPLQQPGVKAECTRRSAKPGEGALSATRGLAVGRRSGGPVPPGSYGRPARRSDSVEPRGQDRAQPGQPAERPDQCQPADHARHTRSVERCGPGRGRRAGVSRPATAGLPGPGAIRQQGREFTCLLSTAAAEGELAAPAQPSSRSSGRLRPRPSIRATW